MRIGLVTGEYPPLEGGVGAFTQRLGEALAAQAHDVHIFTDRRARPAPAAPAARRPSALREPVDIGFATLTPRGRRWRWPEMGLIADWAIRHELDAVNIQYQAAAYNMRSAAINFLPWRLKGVATTAVTFHDLRVPYLFPRAGALRDWVVRRMARLAHGVIVTNADDWAALDGQIPTDRLRQIPIGSNIIAPAPSPTAVAAARVALGIAPDDTLLGYFGFVNPSKGADTLIEALAALPPTTHLLFIGGRTGASDATTNAAFLQALEARVADLGVARRVHWTGFVDDAAVGANLHAADLIVLPYRDGVSLRRGSLMAALAHGRPIITTRPTTLDARLAHGENVWLVPAGDTAALATAVKILVAEPERRAALGRAAAGLAGDFTWARIAADTADFLAGLRAVPRS